MGVRFEEEWKKEDSLVLNSGILLKFLLWVKDTRERQTWKEYQTDVGWWTIESCIFGKAEAERWDNHDEVECWQVNPN